jgi:phosphoglycerate dehydrogenase-like enzyme
MTVIAVTRHGAAEPLADRAFAFAELRSALPLADAVVLCCPLTDETRNSIGARELDCMKADALLVNVARAAVVDEEALFDALRDRRIARAVLDVWYAYPRVGDTSLAPSRMPFHTLPNVRCTPHISAWTEGLVARRNGLVAQNIMRLRDGVPLENRVR